ncbi:MAG: hypothetical protein M1409_08550 [Actinobacteria bacterium]|nr:hypothetical protein [Actinomycetota bacterium]
MVEESSSSKPEYKEKVIIKNRGGGSGMAGAAYGLGFIGAAVYYISHAAAFWPGVLGFLKALVWPAFLVFKLLEFLKM